MDKEEQIAIQTLKEVASDRYDTLGDDISPKMAQNILNLIEKQQKQIETIKEENSKLIYKNVDMYDKKQKIINKQQKEIKEYQKCFEDIERYQKNQMQMQKNLWKRLKGEINE